MSNNKAAGDDDDNAEILSSILGDICAAQQNADTWKDAIVVPLHKKGSTTEPDNSRKKIILLSHCVVTEAYHHEPHFEGPGRPSDLLSQICHRDETQLNTVPESAHFLYRKPNHKTANILNFPLYFAFLDFAAAFDYPEHGRRFHALEAHVVPTMLFRRLAGTNKDAETTAAGMSESF